MEMTKKHNSNAISTSTEWSTDTVQTSMTFMTTGNLRPLSTL